MNPFRSITRLRFTPALFRWPRPRPGEIPIERPPRSKSPRGRVHLLWRGDASPPIPLEIEELPKADGFRFQPWF